MSYETVLTFLPGFAADILVKATLLLMAVKLVDLSLRYGSAAMRHRVWATAFIGLLLLPILSFAVPEYRLAILPAEWFVNESMIPMNDRPLSSSQVEPPARSAEFAKTVESLSPPAQGDLRITDAQSPSNETLPSNLHSIARSQMSLAPVAVVANKSRMTSKWMQAFGMIGLVWCIGLLLTVSPLVLGVWRIMLLQRRSPIIVDQEPTNTLAELCHRLGIFRRVRLLETEQSIVPMTWGLLSPVVLVPVAWRDWAAERRRLVLLHELAHVKRLDVVYQSIGRIVCSLYWFHPIAWYALKRLRIERELACDDCVLMAGELPSQYAQQLLTIALEYQSMDLPPAVAMAQRSGLENRVRAMLDQARSHVPLTSRMAGGMLVASVAMILLLAPIRLGAITKKAVAADTVGETDDEVSQSQSETKDDNSKVPVGTQTKLVNQKDDEPYVFKGSVVHPDGTPAAGASLHFVYFEQGRVRVSDSSIPSVATTDSKGAFEIRGVPDSRILEERIGLVAAKQGFGITNRKPLILFETTGKLVSKSVQRMLEVFGNDKSLLLVADDQPLAGRVLTVDGTPVANASIRVSVIRSSKTGSLDQWEKATTDSKADSLSLNNAVEDGMHGFQSSSIVPASITDSDGKFTLSGIGSERIVEVIIGGPGIETTKVFARTRLGQAIRVPHQYILMRRLPDDVYYPNGFDFVAAPSVPVEGQIVDDATGDPLPGFLVSAGRHMTHISTVTDKNGRYSLTGLAKSDDCRLFVVPPRGSRYLPIGVSPKTKDARDTVKLDMKLKSVALLRGQVKDSATGKPISGSIQYNAMAKNPNLTDYRGFSSCDMHECTTDNDGRYEIAVLPGEGVVTFRADESLRYRRVAKSKSKIGDRFTTFEEMGIHETVPSHVDPKDFQFLKQLQIEKVDTDIELSFELSSGVSLDVRVVKSNGEPAPNAILNGTAEFSGWDSIRNGGLKIEGYYADQGRELFAYLPESHQAAYVQLTGSQTGEIVVTLQPSGTLRGRMVDKQGIAISSVRLLCESIPQDTGNVSLRHTTDKDGKFELQGVVPGYKHTVWALIEGQGMMAIAKDVDVDPAKGLDLGDVTFESI